MKEHTDRMDKAIKDKFEGHEAPVPSHLWNSIESNLPPENGGGSKNFFFKNPFLSSILIIGTVIIASYIYTSTNTDVNTTNTTIHTTTSATPVSQSSSAYSTENVADKGVRISEKENRQSAIADADIHSENTSSPLLSKNQEKSIGIYTNNASASGSSETHSQEKNIPSTPRKPSSVNNRNVNDHSMQMQTQTAALPATKKSSTSNSNSGSFSSKLQNGASTAIAEPASTSAHTIANPASNPSSNISTVHKDASAAKTANNLRQTGSANIPSVNKNTAEQKIAAAVYADSIKDFASTFTKEEHSSGNSSIISNPADNSGSVNNTEATNNNTSNASAAVQQSDNKTSQISSATVSLNSINTLRAPSDNKSLYTNSSTVSKEHSMPSIEQALTYHTHTASVKNNFIDSATNENKSEAAAYANSNADNSNILSYSKNAIPNEVALKMDSTIRANEIASITAENVAKTADATTTEAQKKKSLFLSRCSFDAYVTPAFGYLHLSPGSQEDSTSNFQERNKNSNTGSGITTGLRMNYALTQKIEIGIGLQYSSLSQQSTFTQQHLDSTYMTYQGHMVRDSIYDSLRQRYVFTNRYVITDSISIDAFSTQVTKHTDKFHNISIPIHIAYGYSISNRFSLLARTSLLINYQTYSVTYLNTFGEIVGYNSHKNFSLGGSFSIGGYYQFSRSCSVFAEPIVYYYFSNLFDNQAPFKQTQFMLGLQTGLRLSF